jgi:hypothetical protein
MRLFCFVAQGAVFRTALGFASRLKAACFNARSRKVNRDQWARLDSSELT